MCAELKRASVAVQVDDLAKQIRKYRDGVDQIIAQGRTEQWPLEIICLVGKQPPEWGLHNGPEKVRETLRAVNARIMLYDELLFHAHLKYDEDLLMNEKSDRLSGIYKDIDDFAKE